MGHLPSWEEAKVVGQDREYKDMADMYDAGHGKYAEETTALPKPSTAQLPNTPEPFSNGGRIR